MDFFNKTGKMALGSRLRLLTAKVTEDAGKLYKLYGVELAPKWFPVFFVLSPDKEMTITEIANGIGHSQPSVSKIVREMSTAGLLQQHRKTSDRRRNVVALSQKGQKLSSTIQNQYADVEAAVQSLIESATHNLWEAIKEWEFLLEQQSLFERVREQKKFRESENVILIDYEPQYRDAFKYLNERWISKYFEMEESDYKALDNPEEYIIHKGGKILIALYQGNPVGACALIKIEEEEDAYELAKMAVSPVVQGKGIGWLLGKAAIKTAKQLGGKKLYLESNTILKPAIRLYQKLGFQKISGRFTPYKRCNIQMELQL